MRTVEWSGTGRSQLVRGRLKELNCGPAVVLIVSASSRIEVGYGLAGHSVSALMGLEHLLEVLIEFPLPVDIEGLLG